MIKLDKTNSYYLGDLSKEQKDALCKEAGTAERNRSNLDNYEYMCFDDYLNMWLYGDKPNFEVVNALELFYTLENVQVDCSILSEQQIKELYRCVKYSGYNKEVESKVSNDEEKYMFRHQVSSGNFLIIDRGLNRYTITYDKFMELFSKKEEPKYLVWDRIDYGRKDFIVSCCNLTSSSKDEEESILTEIMKDEYKPTFCETYKSEKPHHYSKGIDTFKRMEENCTLKERLAFAKGNIDKYTWRTKGQDKEDFEKIISYAKWAIKQLENEQYTK